MVVGIRGKAAVAALAAVTLGIASPSAATRHARVTRTRSSRTRNDDAPFDHDAEHELAFLEARHPTRPAAPLPVRSGAASAIGQWSAPMNPGTGVMGIHAILLRTG